MQGLIGRKLGMTQIVGTGGEVVPVTVIEAGPCVVVQRKNKEKDGYEAVQLGFSECKEDRMTKADNARFKKVGVTPRRHLREYALDSGDQIKEGDTLTVSIFQGVGYVDVSGVTKGRGFQGVVRRHRMSGGPYTHGGHSKRRIGSNGQNAIPARVLKGKRMPGHMGNVMVTAQNLEIMEVRDKENLILIKGCVPGPNGALVSVRKALKRKGPKTVVKKAPGKKGAEKKAPEKKPAEKDAKKKPEKA